METIGKVELAKIIAQKIGTTQKQAAEFVNTFIATVEEILVEGNKVQLVGFGTFQTRRRESREGRKPGTTEKIIIPASTVPVFRAGKGLKDKLNPPDNNDTVHSNNE